MALDVVELCSINSTFNPLVNSFVQISLMLVIAHLFNLIFKPLGQPGPINQMLAGLVLSPSFLSRINKVREYFIQDLSALYYRVFAFISRVLFMFLIGLEMDIAYLRTNFRLATTIAAGGFLLSIVFAIPLTLIFKTMYGISGTAPAFFITVTILLANSASPVVLRLIDDLKFGTSELGRLAATASLINEVACILCYSMYLSVLSGKNFLNAFYVTIFTTVLIFINKHLADRFVRWNKDSKYVTNAQVLVILILVVSVSLITEICGYNSTITGFLLGVFFPRDGKTTRTLFKKLAYSINNFVLPIYFGYMAFQCDIRDIKSIKDVIVLLLMFFSSLACKIIGTLAVCHRLKIPRIKGVLLAFILNLKGNFDLLLIEKQDESQAAWWSPKLHRLLLIVVVWNTLFSGPIIADILRRKENYFSHKKTLVEPLDPEAELRILLCAYEPRHASSQLVLTAALNSDVTPYLTHLVELPKKRRKTKLMYNQLEDGQYSDEEDYGGHDVLDINEAVDAFASQTQIRVFQTKIVNTFANMYEDVCNGAEDFRVSIIFLPFHKHQRIDKKMENSKEGYRTTNQKILRHAPCSVGVLVHKNQTGFQMPTGYNNEKAQHAVMLFFGGADDREALALSKRIAKHSNINLTVIRFLPSGGKKVSLSPSSSSSSHSSSMTSPGGVASSRNNDGILVSLSRSHEIELAKDNAFFEEFRLRYVISGQAAIMERYVSNGTETRQVLWEIVEVMECSLFIVGKGSHGGSVMTTGMSDWEECPELGPVGDLLSSADLDIKSSVLVIQQHRQYTHDHRSSVDG